MMNDADLLAAFDAQLAGMPVPAAKPIAKPYRVTVTRGAKAGRVYFYATLQQASRAQNRLDREYGAVCTTYTRIA